VLWLSVRRSVFLRQMQQAKGQGGVFARFFTFFALHPAQKMQ
jgi:hypothetical protein